MPRRPPLSSCKVKSCKPILPPLKWYWIPFALKEIFLEIERDSKNTFEVNLENQEFKIKSSNKKEKFNISAYKKSNMSNGFDDIDYLINKKDKISAFSNKTRY